MSLIRTVVCLLLLSGGTGWSQTPAPSPVAGLGDLLVAPTRLVFEGRKRSAELNLSNIGPARATYRISLVRMEMDEAGGFQERPFDAQAPESLRALFRFSPREVTLESRESQTVRIQVRKPAELPAGEYRLHMVFRAVPATPEGPGDAPSASAKGLSIRLTPVYGIAIPLIIRHGATSARMAITEVSLDAARRILHFRLNREGNQSAYGDVKAVLLPPSGREQLLSEAAGLAVYVPNTHRQVTLALAAGHPLTPGSRIRVTYAQPPMDGGNLLAEATLTIP